MYPKSLIAILILLFATLAFAKKKQVVSYQEASYGKGNNGTKLLISFDEGKTYNHPLYAIWLADENGKYIQTLYVSESVGKGIYIRSKRNKGIWQPGEIQRTATLPYWIHQRNVMNENGGLLPTPRKPVADAYTGATIKNSFHLNVITENTLSGRYKVYFEINQSWDWNDYWFNDKYPDNKEYKTSSQPALVYCAEIDTSNPEQTVTFKPIGHSHFSGDNGSLTTDLSTITTALSIAKQISVRILQH